jgi:hypothetical protein
VAWARTPVTNFVRGVAAGAIADLFIALMPGMLVIRDLDKLATAARQADGIIAFAGAG